MAEREVLTWESFGAVSERMAADIRADGFVPDAVLGIARGGLFLAGALAYSLGIKSVFLINVEFYTGVDARLREPIILPPQLQMGDIADMNLLIADDVADTGATLEVVRDLCLNHARRTRSAVLYEKPISTVRADYVGARTDRWIVFPWSDVRDRAGETA
ncbi:MAG: phosphoribosyltransferase [Thermoleophilia bacterium]|nr:phosphoribosyltransferase [Thermoleophilia bacterium]